MIYIRLLQTEIKQFFRSYSAGENIVIALIYILGFICLAGFLLASLPGVYLLAKQGMDFVKIFSRYFIFWWTLDLTARYICQQLPVNNIKPLLTLNIRKKTLVFYTILKTGFSFFHILYFLFLIPFSVLLTVLGYDALHVFSWFLCVIFIVLANNFINMLLNKKKAVFYTVLSLAAALGALEYYGIFRISEISEPLFYSFYSMPGMFVIPAILLATLFYFSYKLIFNSFYLDKGLSVKTSERKTENIKFLNRFGVTGTFINNDIRMIKRNKQARNLIFVSVFFLFYGLIFRNFPNSGISMVAGIFVTGGFLIFFGQRIPSWDSSCYPLMMTLNISYRKYLEAKWWLMVIATFISMIIGTLYIFVSRDLFLGVIAGGCYNIGVNSLSYMMSGVYNRRPVDLNAKTKAFGDGSNTFHMKVFILAIIQIILPSVIHVTMSIFFGTYAAAITVSLIGLAVFLLRDRVFDYIVKLYKKEKYRTINAFRNTE